MIIKKINKEDSYRYQTKIIEINFDYLSKIESYFKENGMIGLLNEKLKQTNLVLSNIDNKQDFIKIINQINIYSDGLNSSRIENIDYVQNQSNTIKITNYINCANIINNNNDLINQQILEDFHNKIEPNKIPNIRKTTPQFIGKHIAPIDKYLIDALNNFWNIYFGRNEFQNINIFIIWSFQHLYFEIIHPFDDGNGRCGRLLNLLFFKNQENSIFNDFLLEISSNIFSHQDRYYFCLSNAQVYINNEVYSSTIKKSIVKDCNFCQLMLDCLIEKMNLIINYGQLYSQIIYQIKLIFKDKLLGVSSNKLFNFFLSNCIFGKEQLVQYLNLSNLEIDNLISLLKEKNLIRNYNNSEYYLFVIFYEMCKNNPNMDLLNSFIKSK